jgi:hypothetical protein
VEFLINPRVPGTPDGSRQSWNVRVHEIDGYPDMAVETELEGMTKDKATAAAQKFADGVAADPARYFGPVPE